ncbi:hypothetical protein ASD19_12310 [Microbacterium sp. Root53]|uniref:hypothetical protein n=1 Tax=Microbacterium sp. Root53 TaxID=1736553 RepID=UPI0006F970EB|nr:hypothetical protein [Microbacterium sp. Root53]KQZ07232.1 hypothetical protein ASD19_12310 [Microbacterium sp. Root53]
MTPDDGFGPTAPAAGATPPFVVAGPTQLALDGGRRGRASFTVSNVSGRPVRARLIVTPGPDAAAGWFTIAGDAERSLPLAGTTTVDVDVAVPADAPEGARAFTLGAALEESPDQVVPGPTVALAVAPAGRRRFPWWIVIVAAVALVVLAGGGILIWMLTRPEAVGPGPSPTPSPSETPTPTPVPTGPAVILQTTVVQDTTPVYADLDEDGEPDILLTDNDFSFLAFSHPTFVYGLMRGVEFIGEPRFDLCRDVMLRDSVEIQDGWPTSYVCTFTTGGHAAVLEVGPTGAGEPREIAVTVWE